MEILHNTVNSNGIHESTQYMETIALNYEKLSVLITKVLYTNNKSEILFSIKQISKY